MIIKGIEIKETEVITDIVCDMCGNSCKRGEAGLKSRFEYSTFHATWGYWSNRDLELWDCHLCEACSEKVETFIRNSGGQVRIT